MDRRRWMRWAAAAAWMGVAGAGHAADDTVQLRVQAGLGLRALPLWLAQRLGYLAQHGVHVRWGTELDDFEPAGPTVHVLALQTLAQRALQGQPVRAWMVLVRSPQLGLGTAAPSAQVDASYWRSARIGVPTGTELAAPLAAQVLMQRWGVLPSTRQWVVLRGPAQAQAALLEGQVQALCWGEPLLTQLELAGALHVQADLRHPQQSQRWLGGPLVCTCLCCMADDVGHPVLGRFALAVQRALRWLSSASAIDLAEHAEVAGMAHERALFLQMMDRLRATYSVEGALDVTTMRQSMRLLAALPGGVAYQGLDAARLVARVPLAAG
jgi:NitT/TauT family transport system substrate-binding protein